MKNLQFKVLFSKKRHNQTIITRKVKKNTQCTAQSVGKTDLKTERIENYGERQIYTVLWNNCTNIEKQKKVVFLCLDFFGIAAAPQLL